MKKLFLAGCLSLALARLAPAQDAQFVNDGILTNLVDIDAITFVNNGLFGMPVNGNQTNFFISYYDFVLLEPTQTAYDFSDVQNYTNHGTMVCDTGFTFNNSPSSFGVPHMSSSFLNDNVGLIAAGSLTNIFSTSFTIFLNISPTLTVQATNLVSSGVLDVGLNGVMNLAGKTVDLSHGSLNVEGFDLGLTLINGGTVAGGIQTGFLDIGIFVNDWGVSRQTNLLGLANLLPPPLPPPSNVTNVFGTAALQQLLFPAATVFANVNQTATNDITTQVVYVDDTLGQVSTDVRFEPSGAFAIPVVGWTSFYTNVFTGQLASNNLYLTDVFGAATNLGLVTNVPLSPNPTVPPVPINYSIVRTLAGFNTLPVGNAPFNPAIFNNAFGTNITTTTNDYSSLDVKIAQVTFQPDPTVPGQTFTNIGGRIQIQADTVLDLTGTILSGANYVSFMATNHFAGSAKAQMVFPYADVNLRSSNGMLDITNVLAPNVPRLNGPVDAYSARWTNLTSATNFTVNTNGTITTNVFALTNRFHVLMVLSSLSTTAPAQVNNLTLRSTNGGGNLFISDIVDVMSNLVIDAKSLTITSNAPGSPTATGQLNLESANLIWTSSLSTNLANVTNFGTISAQNTVYFYKRLQPNSTNAGDGPYSNFINHSSVNTAGGSVIWSGYFENTGLGTNGGATISAAIGPVFVQAGTALLTNSTLSAPSGDVSLLGGSITISNATLQAGNALNLGATNLLTDGLTALNRYGLNVTNLPTNAIVSNVWTAGAGLNLLTSPGNGDLLGTTITVTAPANPPQIETWAAADRGVQAGGFANNTALGHLRLNGTSTNSVFHFKAASPAVTNALYVDLLELQNGATNQSVQGGSKVFTALNIDTNMTIYFASAVIGNLDISEKLNGANGGRILWVSNYAGLYSSTNVTYPDGRTFAYNRPLRTSLTIDSDGDGTVNGVDPTPFPEPPPTPSSIGLKITVTNQSALISWQVQPGSTNYLYTRTLANTNWQVLTNFVQGPAYGRVTVTNTAQTNRLYKVRVDPAH